MTRRLVILLLFVSLPALALGGEVSFKTDRIRALCSEMSLGGRSVDTTYGRRIQGEREGVPWYVDIDSANCVSNIGYKLFNEDVRDAIPNEVADFIERYILEISLCRTSRVAEKLRDDKVEFLSGRIPVPRMLLNPKSFSLQRDEDGYSAEWNKEGIHHFMMFFPASYELILGAGQAEIEKTVFLELANEKAEYESVIQYELIHVSYTGDIFQSSPVNTYYIDSLSDVRYFRSSPVVGKTDPVFDGELPVESIHNLFLLDYYDDLELRITQSLYGFKTIPYSVKLGQWKNFCAKHGLKTFVGIESLESDGTAKVLLIARNDIVGYNHMLSITMRTDVIGRINAAVDVVLHAYIPTHNIKNLLGDA